MSEVFHAARYAQHIARSLWLYRLDKSFGGVLGIDAAPEAVRQSKSGMHERVGR